MTKNFETPVLEEVIMKRLKSKTYWLHITVGACGLIQANGELLTEALGKKGVGVLMMIVAVVGFAIRELTNASVDQK